MNILYTFSFVIIILLCTPVIENLKHSETFKIRTAYDVL